MLQRVSFGVLGVLGLVFIPITIAIVLAEPGTRIALAVAGGLCVAALEIAWIRVGSVAHRSPTITVPVLAVPALIPVRPWPAINGNRGDAEATAALFIDLDAFKRLNDTHGHQADDLEFGAQAVLPDPVLTPETGAQP